MKIKNRKVYGLEDAILASGYPMEFENKLKVVAEQKDYNRAERLGATNSGSGHDCYLKGIIYQADVTAPQYWWIQFQRYHFADIVSSQSKMHRITKMNLDEQCNEYVLPETKDILQKLVDKYNSNKTSDNFQKIIANTPMGLELKARITTNYLQLKTIYNQRRNHKLQEWQYFCDELEQLPKFLSLTGFKK